MDDTAFHAHMADLYQQQNRPAVVNTQDWKNRHRVSAKLEPETYSALMAYCRKHDLSINSALREILSQHLPNG